MSDKCFFSYICNFVTSDPVAPKRSVSCCLHAEMKWGRWCMTVKGNERVRKQDL